MTWRRPALSPDAVRAWLLSRAVVLALMAVVTVLQVRYGFGTAPLRGGAGGFFAWDADWYRRIAADGYVLDETLRFFPLVALPGRLLSPLGAFVAGVSVVVVANVSALAYANGVARLARVELRDETAARWVPWLVLFHPTAYVLVLGYAEALAAALAVWCFAALRRGAWLVAALAAFLGGLARPVGIVLALPALIEAARGLRGIARRELAARTLAVAGAPLGCAAYLGWVWATRGDPFLPFEVQQFDNLRNGVVVWPGDALWDAWRAVNHDGLVVDASHLVWLPFLVAMLVVAARRLPASYTAYAATVLVLAVGTPRLTSFERYAFTAFPLLMVAATARPRSVRVVTLIVCGCAMAGYAVLAFAYQNVP